MILSQLLLVTAISASLVMVRTNLQPLRFRESVFDANTCRSSFGFCKDKSESHFVGDWPLAASTRMIVTSVLPALFAIPVVGRSLNLKSALRVTSAPLHSIRLARFWMTFIPPLLVGETVVDSSRHWFIFYQKEMV